jgi:type VI secretion system secreted protein VgrG
LSCIWLEDNGFYTGGQRIGGASTVRTLSPGRRFKPYDVANPENVFKEHVIVEIIHTARDNSYETNEGGVEYENTFTAIPAKVPATPHRLTHRPKIEGTQVALVAGPEGEEIHPDQYGRIKLWFPWDRRAKKDGSDTCWVRVAQSWAGAGFGGQIIPRIGMEVMVTHLDGDPDRPLVTGVVPNPRRKVPYKLPENKTKSVFRTNTHKGKGFNEITFEDESGREELFLHAQKDQTIRVLNNRAKRIDLHQTESVGGNKNIDVAQSHQEKIGGNMHLAVGGVGGNLLEMLTKLVSASGAFMKKHDPKIGSEGVSEFAGAIEQVGVAKEAGALLANAIFAEAGGHRKTAGNEHTSKAAAIGGLLSKILPGSGTLNVIVEKFRSDTVGMARTEQIGLYKNTLVGHTQSISVGKTKRELIGEDFDFEAKKSIFSRTKKYTMLGKDKVVIGGPGGTIIIDETGVTIKARHIWFKSPQIDFENGSPDAVALSSDKPFAEDCSAKNRAKGKKGAAPAGGGKTPKRTGFASADAAAKAALKEANPKSISANREFGGNVFKDAKGQYGYSAPAKGSLAGFSPNPSNIPAGSTLVGDYHTHGNYSTAAGVATTKANDAFASDTFSPQDLSGITNDSAGTSEYKGYLGTPSGTFYKFDPLSGTPAAPAAPVVLK